VLEGVEWPRVVLNLDPEMDPVSIIACRLSAPSDCAKRDGSRTLARRQDDGALPAGHSLQFVD